MQTVSLFPRLRDLRATVCPAEMCIRDRLYAKEITQEGEGVLYERFLALKRELEEMGMFAQEYKQPIPRFIKTLGVVTAPTGACLLYTSMSMKYVFGSMLL